MSTPVIQQEFSLSTSYYGQKLHVEIDGIDFTRCVAPKGGTFGDDIITNDSTGKVEGQLVIVNTFGMHILSKPGTVMIDFYIKVPTFQEHEYEFIKTLVARIPMKIIAPGEIAKAPISVVPTTRENFTTTTVMPMSQTFSVDGEKYKNGIFCTSVDLFFYQKSNTNNGDILVSLRTVSNGLPTTFQLYGALSILSRSNINVSTDPNTLVATKFRFPYPIYLEPGKEYALTVSTPDENFLLFLSKVGAVVATPVTTRPFGGSESTFTLGSVSISNKQPGVGKLYKLSNTGSQIEEKGSSLLFTINKAIFETGVKSFVKQNVDLTPAYFIFNSSFIKVNNKKFGNDTSISAEILTKNLTGEEIEYTPVPLNVDKEFSNRRIVKNKGDAKIRITLENKDKNISPALDMSTLEMITKKWEIDSINNVDFIRVSELVYSNGFAKSKYISKIVTLNPDFDSTGLEVKLNVNRKNNTDIDVFCRVKSSLDNSIGASIEKNNWKLMPLYSFANAKSSSGTNFSIISPAKTSVGTSDTFIDETYRILETDSANLTYTSNSSGVLTTFSTFNQFQVKIVMYGDLENNRIPKVKNLIATAVI